jgi:hypothetical protein
MKEIKELIFSSLQLSLLELNNALNESDLDSIKNICIKVNLELNKIITRISWMQHAKYKKIF